MSRFLTTIPSNSGFVNLGLVETYPTGGGGPTAYGPTSYFGSDPLPAEQGDNLNNPIDLGDFSSIFKEELPINDEGYVHKESSIDYLDDDNGALITDYPKTTLEVGDYLFLITNDIRYLETNYAISVNVSVVDWRLVSENILESINFGLVTNLAESTLDFGSIT